MLIYLAISQGVTVTLPGEKERARFHFLCENFDILAGTK